MENIKSFEILSSRLHKLLELEAYTESTVKDMDFILNSLSAYMNSHNLNEYTSDIGEKFIVHCINNLHVCASRVSRAKNIVGKLNRLSLGMDGRAALLPDSRIVIELPVGLSQSLNKYIQYCEEIGNSQSTIDYKKWLCNRFLKFISDFGCDDIYKLTGELVQSAFLALGGYMRYWQRLRLYLRYLFNNGITKQNYSNLIQRCNIPVCQPTVYSADEIRSIEESFDLRSPNGIRNYAITLLMSRYGMRACDVAALTLENIDFDNNRISFIQRKTSEPWEAELLPIVKSALKNYINNARPCIKNCNSLFILSSRPYAAINSGVINSMINLQFRNTQINTDNKRHGSRVFRSSIASNMVNDGVSTEIVRRVLGHGTKYAIKHYARIDVESMRLCPLTVHKPTGQFLKLLSGKELSQNV